MNLFNTSRTKYGRSRKGGLISLCHHWENKFGSSLDEANAEALELEEGIIHLKNSLSENLEFVS